MSTIKESIDLLLRILDSFGFSKLRSEDFRLAKFNDNNVSSQMWRLVFECLYCIQYGIIDDICQNAFNKFSAEELSIYVKKSLSSYGFISRELDTFANDMSQGSRELLLAFGWIMCRENLMRRLAIHCISPLDESDDLSNCNDKLLKSMNVNLSADNLTDSLKQMVWLNGKLRLNLKQLSSLQKERFQLSHTIHSLTGNFSMDNLKSHLSPIEVHLLKHPNLVKKNIKLLEKDNQRLQLLLKWRLHEDEFWQWMESILDLKCQDESLKQPKDDSFVHAADISVMSDEHKRLHDALLKYENIVELLENQWRSKSMSMSEEDLQRMIAAVDAEIDLFIRKVTVPQFRSIVAPNFTYQPRGNVASKIAHNNTKRIRNPRMVEKEVNRLEAILTKLESDVETNYTNFTKEIDDLSSATNSMVLYEHSN